MNEILHYKSSCYSQCNFFAEVLDIVDHDVNMLLKRYNNIISDTMKHLPTPLSCLVKPAGLNLLSGLLSLLLFVFFLA
jgi:hypothetical protein